FPSGGLRATFEARGYTAWDPTSYAFVKGKVLYIPTAFCSYGGEALDKKTPLLRSMDALNRQAMRILRLFGNESVKCVHTCVGPEQEYFLIDAELYKRRPDLIYTGRTLFGARPPKGQELDDHYFGSIKPRVAAFMEELNEELWKLGIQAKTEHNEVAPAQHELAPIYTTTNLATDHNQLTMQVMQTVAAKHGMVCLLHEKPFAGVNGSGKHNNWSISTDTGVNLLSPGETPHENAQFLLFLCAVIQAVDDYQDLLRTSVATAGNDHRLGANEAPPAVVSIFLGDQLTEVVEKIIDGKASVHATRGVLDLGADTLPKLMQDNTDRNRTSPFAFTGNKFEFRACGSEQNVSDSNLVLDAAVAKSLKSFADALEGTPEDEFQDAALEYCKKVLTDHQRILFSGDGYSDEWPVEAEKRGLANNKTTADALPAFVSDKAIALFEETGVLTKAEAQCRYDCKLEKYNKLMNIEATTMVREARRTYRPVITAYATKVAKGLETIRAAGAEAAMQCEQNTLNKLCNGITTINDSIKALDAVHQKAEALDGQEQANVYAHEVVPAMDTLRAAVDAMEEIVAADYWPVPTYDDILFYV
ncbi:MAG: glutamine synthetase III, partial [Collinsella sp.]|nr:glutamine synthetase III [Collinsella sp.]